MKVAVLDMYEGVYNLGLHSIKTILDRYPVLEVEWYDVRKKCELPGTDFDLYISTGGPGSPLEGDGIWDRGYYYLIDKLWKHNQRYENKKYGFFICHSYQMVCQFLSLGSIVKRNAQSLGIYPVHLTEDGMGHDILGTLSNPFYVADSRKWQFVDPFYERIEQLGCKVLAIEKARPHIPLDQAIMAIQFSQEWLGVQFHPEADLATMDDNFHRVKARDRIINERGIERYNKVIKSIEDYGSQMDITYQTIIPGFIEKVIQLKSTEKEA